MQSIRNYINGADGMRLLVALLVMGALIGGVIDPATASMGGMAAFMIGDTSIGDLKKILEDQGRAWEEFKKTNDTALAAHKADYGDVREKLGKINADLDRYGNAMKEIETRQQRMMLEGSGGDRKDAMTPEQKAYKTGFVGFMRKGVETGLSDLQEKAMSVGSDPDGGYLVPQDTSGRMIEKIFETSPMRQHASAQTISTDALEGPNDLNDGVAGGWVSETGARPNTGTPQVGKWRIPVHEMYAYPLATQTLLDDGAVDVEAWLTGKTTGKMSRVETTAFFTGSGNGQPRGLLTYPTAATPDSSRTWGTYEHVATGTSGGYGATSNGMDKLVDLVHKVKAAYRPGSAFWMSRASLGTTRQLKDATGAYLWLPAASADQLSTLLGYPVVEAEDMPIIAANSLSVGFGNMGTTYQIVDRMGFRVLRDPYSNKPYVGFYITRRVGGDSLHFESFKFMKFI